MFDIEGSRSLTNLLPEDVEDLDRRIVRAIESNRGITLSRVDLDLLAASGAVRTWRAAATEALECLASRRLAQRRKAFIKEGNIGSTGTPEPTEASEPPISPSSGTTENEDAHEALRRLQQNLKPRKRRADSKPA